MEKTFEKFIEGNLITTDNIKGFTDISWNNHPTFEGVKLKHLITGVESQGSFSYHLVRIIPRKKIGFHVHKEQIETHEVIAGSGLCILNGAEYQYIPGTITVFQKNESHEIIAGEEGLFLFAKFFPALC